MIYYIIIYFQTDVNIESCEVVISSDVQQSSLNNLNQSSSSTIIINIPHASNILTKANTTLESNNFSYLPMVESLSDSSDSSMNIDPEYNDPILEVQGGRKRKLIDKKKTKKKLKKIHCRLLGKLNAATPTRVI